MSALTSEQTFSAKKILYDVNAINILEGQQSIFSKNKTLTTKKLNEDAGAGNKITRIVFYKDNVIIKTLNVNAQRYSGAILFNGEQVPVVSKKNDANGTWFAWQRYAAGGRNNHWYPGISSYIALNGDPESESESRRCMPPPEKETVSGQRMDKYPGCYIQLMATYPRTQAFKSLKFNRDFPSTVIEDNKSILASLNPWKKDINPVVDWDQTVTSPTISGKSDKSTQIVGFEVKDLNGATVTFTQKYDHVGYKYNLPATGAAMMFFFAAYTYDIHSYTYRYPDLMKVYYTDEDNSGCPPGQNCNPADTKCSAPVPSGKEVRAEQMNPAATGSIQADKAFDVSLGIPTSETLRTNVLAPHYLFKHKFVEMIGTCQTQVEVGKTYVLHWDPGKSGPVGPDGQPGPILPNPQTQNYRSRELIEIERKYSYWVIDTLEVYDIDRADIRNYALPGEQVTLIPRSYVPVNIETKDYDTFEAHAYLPDFNKMIELPSQHVNDGGKTPPPVPNEVSTLFAREAELRVPQMQVRNDQLLLNGQLLMNGAWHMEKTTIPQVIPQAVTIGHNVLNQSELRIDSHKPNVRHARSEGIIFYTLNTGIRAGSDKQFTIKQINPVTVHTPTVMYASISDDKSHNQKTIPNAARAALILNRPFIVALPTTGKHVNYPGYGQRDYAKYIRDKQVYFPFDVYASDGTYVPKHTWVSIPVSQATATFHLPVWVDEGDYAVYYRAFAENASLHASNQSYANTELSHHVAVDTIDVEVIGRLYDFRISDIMDLNWEQVFRVGKGSKDHSGFYYWTGLNDLNGAVRGNKLPYRLPIAPGSHPAAGFQRVVVKTGYAFKFDLKTIGNMFGSQDHVRIKPAFYFTDRNGSKRQPVDVYYHTDKKLFVRIGSTEDTLQRKVTLNTRLRNVAEPSIRKTAEAYFDLFASTITISKQAFVQKWLKTSIQETPVGGYSHIQLPYQLRTFIGPGVSEVPYAVDAARAAGSIQQWYGEYNVPAKLYIVPKGFQLQQQFRFDEQSPFFLRDGYLIVQFNIDTIRNDNTREPHLQYIHAPLTNQWRREGFPSQHQTPEGTVFELRDGDVIFYEANQSKHGDYYSSGTH
ncbi:DUF5704 domain-containing protein [Paenibacillus taiwanensis]|uniref:DUF5704 domain-containing protein n=1 Tax=Paenibacillus taiwanensis TaxID=401638 RepID=UPI0012F87BFE|nr:DUF5704 domain-containing protein [Paenibacillus taiwanensis]